jgi:hypothetical protein
MPSLRIVYLLTQCVASFQEGNRDQQNQESHIIFVEGDFNDDGETDKEISRRANDLGEASS